MFKGITTFIAGAIVAVAAIFLALNNPSEKDMRAAITKDGWLPTSFERTNLLVCSWANVKGLTGAKATFVGVAGKVIQVSGKK